MTPVTPPPMDNTSYPRASFYQVPVEALTKWTLFENTVASLEKAPSLVPAEALKKWTTIEITFAAMEKPPTRAPAQALAKWALLEKTFDAMEKVPSLVAEDALTDWASFEEKITDTSFESDYAFEDGAFMPDDGTAPEKATDDTVVVVVADAVGIRNPPAAIKPLVFTAIVFLVSAVLFRFFLIQ